MLDFRRGPQCSSYGLRPTEIPPGLLVRGEPWADAMQPEDFVEPNEEEIAGALNVLGTALGCQGDMEAATVHQCCRMTSYRQTSATLGGDPAHRKLAALARHSVNHTMCITLCDEDPIISIEAYHFDAPMGWSDFS